MMSHKTKTRLATFGGAALVAFLTTSSQAVEMSFKHVMNIGSEGSAEGQFKYVEDFAIGDGKILATDAAHAYVQVFDKTSGQYLTRFGGKGDDDHHLEKPEGISIDPQGNTFVADYTTGYVKVYDRDYKWVRTTQVIHAGILRTKGQSGL